MTERKIIHIIRTSSGDVMATARGISKEAAESWRVNGSEVFAFEIELPVEVGVDTVVKGKLISG